MDWHFETPWQRNQPQQPINIINNAIPLTNSILRRFFELHHNLRSISFNQTPTFGSILRTVQLNEEPYMAQDLAPLPIQG